MNQEKVTLTLAQLAARVDRLEEVLVNLARRRPPTRAEEEMATDLMCEGRNGESSPLLDDRVGMILEKWSDEDKLKGQNP